ncbi:hypothetical protein FRB94_011978 [Tulasnella sp. JGI-2019a]|nr:hypothetical protein FRB93_012742 [Tulasnella sp. JGI-2019a]KAG9009561.1 hypothetical protein FRB94_011978 [Tulasnella sp. JGI-2019a]KAG9034525.1 hypothetical protein FRB95_013092 [Tulasnella sp. JGI-2019a]
MDIIKYTIVDAFTSSPFRGNPAAVVILEAPTVLSDTLALNIAAEFNLSETAFVTPKPLNDADTNSRSYGLRWFTPASEVPLCGHATLASARVLFAEPRLAPTNVTTLKFETLSGVLTAQKVKGGGDIELEFPASTLTAIGPDAFAEVAEVVCEAAGGSVSIRDVQGAGFFLLVHVDEGFDLEHASVNASPFLKLASYKAIILTSSRPSSLAPQAKFISRIFAPAVGLPEDPVTGSAHCVLAPYWAKVLNVPSGHAITARQASSRGGDLEVVWDEANARVKMRGNAIVVARGEMYIN